MPNLWHLTVRDNKGAVSKFELRGPESEPAARAALFDTIRAMTLRAIESGAPDPELQIVECRGNGEDYASPHGSWKPAGAMPVDLGKYEKPDPAEDILKNL